MTTAPTQLAKVIDAIEELVGLVDDIAGGAKLFGTPARVSINGEFNPAGPWPTAIITFDDEEAEDLDRTNTKQGQWLPWVVEVAFSAGSEPDGDNLSHKHTNLVRLVKDQFGTDANRRLPHTTHGNTASETHYTGGGARLTPISGSANEAPAAWRFRLFFRTLYRHRIGDSTVAA